MAFDVTSVKQNKSGEPAYRNSSNFPLGGGESYPPNGGLFTATNFPVSSYIGFAYKLTSYQRNAMAASLPKWAKDERFDIEARGGASATKDQMRLMMRSLLADRFKLVVHTERHEGPIFAMVLVKPGEMGPKLHPHSNDLGPCGAFTTSPSARLPGGVPSSCDVFLTLLDAHAQTSARNVSMEMIANSLGPFDRPVVDRTGLSGLYDFTMEWTPETTEQMETATGYLEALKEQLGLKLESTTGPITSLIVDRIEEPSPN
ncbi:MAG TPA: TIGR03435 family protein [Candidatus Acidoferrales bacterium]